MNKVEGLHHLAISTANMKEQIEFFTDKLGMELVALYWMHGVENTWHGFLRLNDESSIAFVCNPDIKDIPVRMGETHAGNPGANSSRGTMQHLALKVKNHEELLAMSDRIAVVQHGTIQRTVDASELSHDDLVRASADPMGHLNEEAYA